MNHRIDFDLIDRQLSGEASAEETELLAALRDGVRDPAADWDTESAWQRAKQSMQTAAAPRRHRFRHALALAAAAVLVAALGIGISYRTLREGRLSEGELAVTEHRAAAGSVQRVRLADGSTVVLAAGSVLRVPRDFPAGGRQVALAGQGFFEVVHDAARPFMVTTTAATVTVLGTTFDVSAYPELRGVDVVVATGRVRLQQASGVAAAVLTPGQLGHLENGVVKVQPVEVQRYTAWTEGRLALADMRLADALPRLERWFGIDIEVADRTLEDVRVSAFFEKQTADEAVALLAETLGARYERVAGRYVLHQQD